MNFTNMYVVLVLKIIARTKSFKKNEQRPLVSVQKTGCQDNQGISAHSSSNWYEAENARLR